MKDLQVKSVRYFKTRRGLGYECRTNLKSISIWNNGTGGPTFIDGNEYTKDYRLVRKYSEVYNEYALEKLIDDYESKGGVITYC